MTALKPTTGTLLENLHISGVAVLPRAIPGDAAAFLAERAWDLVSRWQEHDASGRLNEEDQYALSVGTIHFGALLPDPIGSQFIKDLMTAAMTGPAWRVFRRLFGDEVGFPLRTCSLRWHQPPFDLSPVPLHQDVGFLGSEFQIVNCWLTFTDAGQDAAGLEIAPVKLMRELPKLGSVRRATNIKFWSIEIDADAAGPALPAADYLRPSLTAGDAVLFDQFTPHRTLISPEMTEARISVELRGCSAANLTTDYRFPEKLVIAETEAGLMMRHDEAPATLLNSLNKP